jgi:cytochrome c oxidase subunit 3
MAVAAVHVEARRPNLNQAGLWLFFLSEAFLFSALVTARFVLAGTDRPEELSQVLGLGITSVLLLSSLTAYRAETAIARGDRAGFQRNLLATIFLGLVFVGGVGVEWTTAEFSLSDPYGTAFFSMTGLHAGHVVSGIIMLTMVYWLGRRGHFSAERHWGVEGTIKYWHYVDVVWVFFYPTLYLVNL